MEVVPSKESILPYKIFPKSLDTLSRVGPKVRSDPLRPPSPLYKVFGQTILELGRSRSGGKVVQKRITTTRLFDFERCMGNDRLSL